MVTIRRDHNLSITYDKSIPTLLYSIVPSVDYAGICSTHNWSKAHLLRAPMPQLTSADAVEDD
ncbi:hypothetical protein [Pseudovibrio sp. FO-BEG1]|uniref:hypothetical protein n=1 Tax=Pseudovibrio sp. (strain FO-BEG1) TaxID=911045 RepID=UPI0011D2BCB1|nr:hypothetical protein [Pseudovibrio sp. FO-BEG1]